MNKDFSRLGSRDSKNSEKEKKKLKNWRLKENINWRRREKKN
jgi:hypothetical protein